MPRATRQQIRPRGVVNVDDRTGSSGVPAATRTSADSYVTKDRVIAPVDTSRAAAFRQLSGIFAELEQQVKQEEARARSGGGRGGSRGESDPNKAAMDAIDRIAGEAAGLRLFSEVEEKTRTGEMGTVEQARESINALISENAHSPAFLKKLEPYAIKGIQAADANIHGRQQAEEMNTALGLFRQGFNDLHTAYDPERHDDYLQARTELFESRKDLGISGQALNELELASIANQTKRYAMTEPAKAYALMELAEQSRADGSPSLAASAQNGYSTLQQLHEYVARTVIEDSDREKRESASTLKETSQDNYISLLRELDQLPNAEVAGEWAKEKFDNLSDSELKVQFGDYRGQALRAVLEAKSNQQPVGNDAALAEHLDAIQRGTAEWGDVDTDGRLSRTQKVKLFGEMQRATQDARLGYMSDASLANMLMEELESNWSQSIYKTPWSASRQPDPSKPAVVAPEGAYYRGVLLKRLREVEPNLDVNASNQRKLEIMKDVRNDVLSGRERWADNAGTLDGPFPQLKLSEKVKDGLSLSDTEVAEVARTFSGGGSRQVKDAYGIDYYLLDGEEQRRIAAESQRQKAEIEALRSQSFGSRMRQGIRDTLGLPEPQYEAFEWEQQSSAEASRLTFEGMGLDNTVMMGTFRHEDSPEFIRERLVNTIDNERREVAELESQLKEEQDGTSTLSNLKVINTGQRLSRKRKALRQAEERFSEHQQNKDNK